MQLFELFAGMALVVEDVLVGISVLGSLGVLVLRLADYFRARRSRPPEILLQWSLLGWGLGLLLLVSVMIVGWTERPLGFIFRSMSATEAGVLLALSLAVMVAGKLLVRKGVVKMVPASNRRRARP